MSAGAPGLPRVASSEARRTAVRATAAAHRASPSSLRAGVPALWIYDPKVMGSTGVGRATLVWRMDVVSLGAAPIRELVLVDARLGNVILHFDQIETARYRRVCDAGNTPTQVPCESPVRTENDPTAGVADVNGAAADAFANAEQSYDSAPVNTSGLDTSVPDGSEVE